MNSLEGTHLRPKIIMFPVFRPGELKGAKWVHHIFAIFLSFPVFSTQRIKYMKILVYINITCMVNHWTGNELVLRDAPELCYLITTSDFQRPIGSLYLWVF